MKAAFAALALLAACGKGPGTNEHPDGATPDAAGWTPLISRSWSLDPDDQLYRCVRMQTTQDYWIDGFQASSPVGTHHEVLTIDTNDTATGDYDCDPGAGTLNGQMVFAAGIDTDALMFPTGIAVHIPAGTWLNLNLHLFDVSDSSETGTSGVEIHTVDSSTVVHEADMTFSGTFNISVPPDDQPHTASGGCTAPTDWHLFALWPHMHQIGTHQSFQVTHDGTPTMLLDTDYSFTEQKNYPMDGTVISAGDTILTTCTYVNDTGATINFGDSSTDEMCFTGMYKYPAGSSTFACTTGGP